MSEVHTHNTNEHMNISRLSKEYHYSHGILSTNRTLSLLLLQILSPSAPVVVQKSKPITTYHANTAIFHSTSLLTLDIAQCWWRPSEEHSFVMDMMDVYTVVNALL